VPPARFQIPLATRQSIRDVLAFTADRFGAAKARDYASLVRHALGELVKNPRAGRPRHDIHPEAWVYPIARPGRNARHLFLYEIVDGEARIYGFFYDAMDLPHQWQIRDPRQ
jgi:plasmid stabilization system protein ParE